MNEAEKAEFIQSLKAYAIPSSMFVACLFNAAGIYLLSVGHSAGIAFLVTGFAIIIWAMVAFVQFQNKLHAQNVAKSAAKRRAAAELAELTELEAELEQAEKQKSIASSEETRDDQRISV